jgi:hypothetical protein
MLSPHSVCLESGLDNRNGLSGGQVLLEVLFSDGDPPSLSFGFNFKK